MPHWSEKPDPDGAPRGLGAHRHRSEEGAGIDSGEALPPAVRAVIDGGAVAWRPFLQEYSRFILGCLRRLSSDHDERMDMYLHVCTRLYEDDCRRLRTFRGGRDGRACKFTTWLAAVTMNLGREWLRQSRGRRRAFRLVDRLPHWHRRAFEYHFWDGYGIAETTELLRSRHEAVVSETDVAAALGDIRHRLGRGALWRLIARRRSAVLSLSGERGASATTLDTAQLAARTIPPEAAASTTDAVATLRVALATLPERERRSLELRFRDGLTAKQIASELDLKKFKQVYELQARALTRLRAVLIEKGWTSADFLHMHRIGG